MFTKLRTRLTLIFISLTVLPLTLVTLIFAVRVYNDLVADSIGDQQLLNSRFRQAIEDTITERVNELMLLGDMYQFDSLILSEQTDLVTNLLVRRDAYEEIAVLNPDGHERIRVSRYDAFTEADMLDLSEDPLYKETITSGEVRFSGVRFDDQSGEPLLTIAVPLENKRTGEISSILFADFRFRLIWNLVAQLQTESKQELEIFLTDASGLVVAHANPTIALRGTVFGLPAEDGQATGLDDSAALVTTQRLALYNQAFVIVSEEPLEVALRPATEALVGTSIITLLAIVAAILVVTAVVRQIVRPIEQLSQTARIIREGNLAARTTVTGQDEIGVLAQSFNEMTARLQALIQSLEDRVAERVRDITLASEASRQISTELDSARLLDQVAQLTASAFSFYHVSIFLYDEADQTLKLRQGTGDIGVQMVAQKRQLPIGASGLVALAARTQRAAVANDVMNDTSHLPNPLLPATQSELAVPMLYQGKLVGILDLQSEKINRFRDEDTRIMNTLAEQIAVAVRNSQLFEELGVALQQAEQANAVKSSFLASMSHELRTPLNAVINFTKFVVKGVMGPINERQQQTLNTVISSAQHLLSLINDVLDMSKIESGALTLFVEDNVDLNEILNDTATTAKSLLDEKPVELRLEVQDKLPLMIGDRQRILQVMLNIISNACKFTDTGSITIRASQENGHVQLAVTDTGPGISAEDQSAVFEPFRQTETGLRQGGGTGLGMPISKSLVEAHGGSIRLESAPGQGTTFYVTLPVKSGKLTPSFN